MQTLAIKNLSIALEALSRCLGLDAESNRIRNLLINEITRQEQIDHEMREHMQRNVPDDEIPF